MVASDLRSNDAVRSLVEIPATVIDNGEFKNVLVQVLPREQGHRAEHLRRSGGPSRPGNGIYGSRAKLERLRKLLRSYLAGYLTTRDEISSSTTSDSMKASSTSGNLTLEVTPTTAPDAYGAWWLSLQQEGTGQSTIERQGVLPTRHS